MSRFLFRIIRLLGLSVVGWMGKCADAVIHAVFCPVLLACLRLCAVMAQMGCLFNHPDPHQLQNTLDRLVKVRRGTIFFTQSRYFNPPPVFLVVIRSFLFFLLLVAFTDCMLVKWKYLNKTTFTDAFQDILRHLIWWFREPSLSSFFNDNVMKIMAECERVFGCGGFKRDVLGRRG